MNPGQFVDPTYIMFAKLVLALFLGGVIGTERAVVARQAAGTRTFGLVALGACLFVITSNYVDSAFLGVVNFDPMRVAASIIMGVGFIGGGLIIFRGEVLHGITTAAGLWIAAALGIAVGYGLYSIAIFSTVLVLLVFTGMWYLENRFKHWFEERNPEAGKKENNSL
ncbi:MAG: MgtC/SapB family protein [bacterium]|nr:MgtC/SapB family protein [bacterium]